MCRSLVFEVRVRGPHLSRPVLGCMKETLFKSEVIGTQLDEIWLLVHFVFENGTFAVAFSSHEAEVYCGNAGDSRAVIAHSNKGQWKVPLSLSSCRSLIYLVP